VVIDRLKRLFGAGGRLSAAVDLAVQEADAGRFYAPRVDVEWTWEPTDCAYYVYVRTPATDDLEEFGGAGVSVAHGYEESTAEPRQVVADLDAREFGTAVSRARGAGYPEGDPRLFVGDEPAELTLGVAAAVGYDDKNRIALLLELGEERGLDANAAAGVVTERTVDF